MCVTRSLTETERKRQDSFLVHRVKKRADAGPGKMRVRGPIRPDQGPLRDHRTPLSENADPKGKIRRSLTSDGRPLGGMSVLDLYKASRRIQLTTPAGLVEG